MKLNHWAWISAHLRNKRMQELWLLFGLRFGEARGAAGAAVPWYSRAGPGGLPDLPPVEFYVYEVGFWPLWQQSCDGTTARAAPSAPAARWLQSVAGARVDETRFMVPVPKRWGRKVWIQLIIDLEECNKYYTRGSGVERSRAMRHCWALLLMLLWVLNPSKLTHW